MSYFVTGTDTGVGKTQVARAVCAALLRAGLRPLALKPVETGCSRDAPEDALALREACGGGQPLEGVIQDRALDRLSEIRAVRRPATRSRRRYHRGQRARRPQCDDGTTRLTRFVGR